MKRVEKNSLIYPEDKDLALINIGGPCFSYCMLEINE